MKIYFTASTTYDGKLKNNYKKIFSLLRKYGAMLSGQQIIDDKLLKKDQSLSKKAIFKREKELIEQADCVVAEVSQPSHGVGGEIVYALIKEKPVLALLFENYEDRISPMIVGNPSDNFFFEYYTEEKLPYVLKEFISHIKLAKKRKGKLIVIEGGDGSGKATQAQMLVEYLKKRKIPVKYVDFPQYYSSFHGKTVARFLRGEFGTIDQVSPYLICLAFALDRASVKKEMDDFLEKGGIIIANRYATSSMTHHGAKFNEKRDRQEFIKWVYDLEYKVNKIPKENLVIYLYVPWQIGLSLTQNKPARAYLEGKTSDIHEQNIDYRKSVEKMYLHFSTFYKHWVKIDCCQNGKILPRQVIHQKILQVLKEKGYIV